MPLLMRVREFPLQIVVGQVAGRNSYLMALLGHGAPRSR
jgi:hypothetical protein